MDNPTTSQLPEDHKKPWYKKIWLIWLIIIAAIVMVFLAYFIFMVYNEYQNIKINKQPLNNIEKWLATKKSVKQNNPLLDYSNDPTLGSEQAKVKIIEFGCFQCSFSRNSFSIINNLANYYGNQILITYRDFPLSSIHPQAMLASEAAGCAQNQGKFWAYHDKLFLNQEKLAKDDLLRYARELNLDYQKFQYCLDNNLTTNEIQEDYQAGQSLGVRGTPTFFINGIMVEGSASEELLKAIINHLLKSNINN